MDPLRRQRVLQKFSAVSLKVPIHRQGVIPAKSAIKMTERLV